MSSRPSDSKRSVRYLEIDGLRGVAVALVVLFHVYVGRVSGGVDVFLFLSGYFFLGGLLRYFALPDASLNPLWPLWRTIRRLVPALVTLLLAVGVTSTAFVQTNTLPIAKQITASLLYAQNWKLAEQSIDYRSASNTASPLQHLWSMSVQGQFYLVAIVLVILCSLVVRAFGKPHAVGKLALPILALITVASFIYATKLHGENQGLNYYSSYSRAWELTSGALAAFVVPHLPIRRWLARILTFGGLLAIASTGFLLDGAQVFPGPGTLLPLLGAFAVILGARERTFTGAFLGSRICVWLGNIGYSLYLWHWPILIFTLVYLKDPEPSIALGTGVIAVSVLVAWISYRCVELPLRSRQQRPRKQTSVWADTRAALATSRASRLRLVGACCIALMVGAVGSIQPLKLQHIAQARSLDFDLKEHPGALSSSSSKDRSTPDVTDVPDGIKPIPPADVAFQMWPKPAVDGCLSREYDGWDHVQLTKRDADDSDCIYGDPNARHTVVLFGGSHAEQWFTPLLAAADHYDFNVRTILRPGCAATLEPTYGLKEGCVEWTKAVLKYLKKNTPDVVVTTSTRPGWENTDYTPEGYVEVWDALDRMGSTIIGIRDTPWVVDDEGLSFYPTFCVASGRENCSFRRDLTLSPINDADVPLGAYSRSLSLDFSDVLCRSNTCDPIIGNIYVYRDDNHLTDHFASTMSDLFIQRLGPTFKALS
ncbi:acyltransferase family protein [Corynebacterium gerontici]|uniref:O-acetyltransferase OatA n=1 Tax=Corynebacterium gerontici TaxID=2079234 RepID=A0A3G6J166_9CORY|nr:acyltransferase family protein [Corynebacterium gerontici]AZA11699.1 O-acetyltransferase OatA [Corynebacterium gerontici]